MNERPKDDDRFSQELSQPYQAPELIEHGTLEETTQAQPAASSKTQIKVT